MTTPEWQIPGSDLYEVNRIGKLLGIEKKDVTVQAGPTKEELEDYVDTFRDECIVNPEIDYFLFVFCASHSTNANGQHSIIIN